MIARFGLLVQMAQLLAQLFIDWSNARQTFNEPFTFMVPRSAVSDLKPEYTGVLVTISPIRKHESMVNITELGVVQAVRGTIGNKLWKPNLNIGQLKSFVLRIVNRA